MAVTFFQGPLEDRNISANAFQAAPLNTVQGYLGTVVSFSCSASNCLGYLPYRAIGETFGLGIKEGGARMLVRHAIAFAMTSAQLQPFNGAPVQITVDGAPAVGILFFAEPEEAYVTSLCFMDGGRKCPQLRHKLTAAELQGLSWKCRRQLHSTIALVSKDPARNRTQPHVARRASVQGRTGGDTVTPSARHACCGRCASPSIPPEQRSLLTLETRGQRWTGRDFPPRDGCSENGGRSGLR